MDGETASVATVSSRAEAEVVAGVLTSNGLSAVVSADDVGGQDPALQLFGVHVFVAKSDEASARQVLAAADRTLGSAGQCGAD
jgi:hypothetical protein